MVRTLSDRHHTLKDNSWMFILHQYHKASGLKLCSARGKWGKYIRKYDYFKMAASSREPVFSSGTLAAMKECKIIPLKYPGKSCRLYFHYILVHPRI